MAKSPKTLTLTRREFGKRAVLAGASAAIVPTQILSATPSAAIVAATKEPGLQQDAKLSPDSQAEVEAKIAAIMRKYGSRFNDAQKADIRRLVNEGQKPLETIRAFALDNSDQPANVMRIYPDSAAAATRAPIATLSGNPRESRKG